MSESEPDNIKESTEVLNVDAFKSKIRPGKLKNSRFKRGQSVLCWVIYPGNRRGQLLTLKKEENILIDRSENRKFVIAEPPQLELIHKERIYNIYVCDAEKGCTARLQFERDSELSRLFCDPVLVANIIDESFISRASKIKSDWKQVTAAAFGSGLIFFLFGLMF
ncbi:MAG: hypothetical protein PHW56_11340 [Methanosarcinaceae archaeon]|nr:hypothetical protein [Methanosarcinaceae archaeon]